MVGAGQELEGLRGQVVPVGSTAVGRGTEEKKASPLSNIGRPRPGIAAAPRREKEGGGDISEFVYLCHTAKH